jgi:hypothetical protein
MAAVLSWEGRMSTSETRFDGSEACIDIESVKRGAVTSPNTICETAVLVARR